MFDIHTRRFNNYKNHHDGWFRIFLFGNPVRIVEIWAGSRYLVIDWSKT